MPYRRCKKCDKIIGNTECRCPDVCKDCGHPKKVHRGGKCRIKTEVYAFGQRLDFNCSCKKFDP
jgi:hypothetical protein